MIASRRQIARRRRIRGQRGFSAVELLLAITMLGILMLGFMSIFPLGTRTVRKSEKLSIATSLAQDELERLKSLRGSDADLVAGVHNDATNPILGVYTRSWTITDDVPMNGLKTIDMSVAYTDNGIPRTVQMSTFLAP